MGKEKDIDDEEIELASAFQNKEKLTSGSTEMDNKMGGGIPAGSLTLIEGANDTGKSVLTQQLMWGALQQGFSLATYTTENTIKSLLKQMDSLSLDVSDYYVFGNLQIYPIHLEGVEWTGGVPFLDYIATYVKAKPMEVILIDSLTVFVSDSSDAAILNFFASCKKICDSGKTILITAHTFAFGEEVLTRVRSICDGHISMKKEEVGDRLVRTMEVAKIRGAQKTTGNVVAFEVEPAFGLRIIPISRTKA
jgi:flagellar protein FlaH